MDTSFSIAKSTFRSPINLDRSSGTTPLSSDTESTMELYGYSDDAGSGFIEWIVDEFDIVEQIGLVYGIGKDGKRFVEDYDGVFALPDQAMDLLEANGIDCAEMRKSMAA